MIPLRTPAPLTKFPTFMMSVLLGSLFLTMMFSQSVSSSDSVWVRILVSAIVFPSRPLGFLCLWYLWIFYPCFQMRTPKLRVFDFAFPLIAFVIVAIGVRFEVETSVAYTFTLLIFGSVMRNLIWENVDTLVFGPKLFSVYSVPSYVHLFFFLFYLFLCQVFRPAYGMPGKTIYLVSLISFLVGFFLRSAEDRFLTPHRG
jgi:hypothetical protein